MRTALVLGGGGTRAAAHIGVLQAFEEKNISIDYIVGCSGGAIIGALYSYLHSTAAVKTIIINSPLKTVINKKINFINGFSDGHGLFNFIDSNLQGTHFDAMTIKFYCTATDFSNGKLTTFSSGSVAKAVQCSCAIPPYFSPVEHNGNIFVDGGAIAPLPVATAKELGADYIIASDVGLSLPTKLPKTLIGNTMRYHLLSSMALYQSCTAAADLIIKPNMPGQSILDDSKIEYWIKQGYQAACGALIHKSG